MFISNAFPHGGPAHLAVNSVALLLLGKFVSMAVGGRALLVLLVAAIAGAACLGLCSSSAAPMIGAPGAVFGLIGLWRAHLGGWTVGWRPSTQIKTVRHLGLVKTRK